MKTQKAFTIVELLIVIVVIGILAAVTIVAFNGVQKRAGEASVKADLTSAAKLVSLYKADSSSYPVSLSLVNNTQGFTATKGNDINYTSANGTSFCITVFRQDIVYSVSDTNLTPQASACPGHSNGPPVVAQYQRTLVPQGDSNYTPQNYTFNFSAGIQPSDILVVFWSGHYYFGTGRVLVNGSEITPVMNEQWENNRVKGVITTGIAANSTVMFTTTDPIVATELSFYVIRGVGSPSTIASQKAIWSNQVRSQGYVHTVPSQPFHNGQIAIMVSARGTMPHTPSPAIDRWTVNSAAGDNPPKSAYIVANSSDTTIAASAIATSASYMGATIYVFGE